MKVLRITVAVVTLGPLSLSSAFANGAEPPGTNAFSRLVNNMRQRHNGSAPIAHPPIAHPPAAHPPAAPIAQVTATPVNSALGSSLMHQLASHWHSVPVTHADTCTGTPEVAEVAPAPLPNVTPKVMATATPASAPKVEEESRVHPAFAALLAKPARPTAADVTKAVAQAYGGKLLKENPFGRTLTLRDKEHAVAEIVAQLEHAFPGGTWLPLGRDAVLIADLLEGFYASIGQPSRVRRLDASGNSFPHYRNATPTTYEQDRPTIYGYLKSNGLDLDHVDKKPPFIMIDVTGYSPSSQSTQLVRSVYRTWVERGGDPKALYDRVNFVGISGSGVAIDRTPDLAAAKAKLKAEVTKDGPRELLYLGSSSTSGLTYTSAWHWDFGKFTEKGGEITAPLGEPMSKGQRLEVLSQLYEVGQLTASPTLLSKVKEVAREKYGYEFPMTQTERLVRLAPRKIVEKPATTLVAKTESAKQERPMRAFLQALTDRMLVAANRDEVAEDFLGDLAGMWSRGSVTADETRTAVVLIRRWQSHLDDVIKNVLNKHPTFEPTLRGILADAP